MQHHRQLRPLEQLLSLPPDSPDIYTRSQVQKYLDIGPNANDLTMKEYFQIYFITRSVTARETTTNPETI
jgi:hypothetical protein